MIFFVIKKLILSVVLTKIYFTLKSFLKPLSFFNFSQKNGHLTIIIGKETRKLYNLHKERLADIETHSTKYLTRITNTKCL